MDIWPLIGWAMLVFAFFGPTVIALLKISKNPLYKKNFIQAPAVITYAEMRNVRVWYSRYTVTRYFHNFSVQLNGNTVKYQSKYGLSKEFKPGTEVQIKFDSNNPSVAEIKCFGIYFDPFETFVLITLPLLMIYTLIYTADHEFAHDLLSFLLNPLNAK